MNIYIQLGSYDMIHYFNNLNQWTKNETKTTQLPPLRKYTNHIWMKVYSHKHFIGQILRILKICKVRFQNVTFPNIVHFQSKTF